MDRAAPLLRVCDLRVDIDTAAGPLHAVRGIGFTLERGEALGIVGESGSGKSMTALALMGLLPARARRSAAAVELDGADLLAMPDRELAARVNGKAMAMVFQEPMTSLNPVYTIGRQLTEMVPAAAGRSRGEARSRALFLLEKVGIPAPRERMGQYPHELSGGQRQRVMIAMALMNEPRLVIADEPTTALDVTIQAQILRLIAALQRELGMAMILITHDLGIVSRTVDRVAVMYAGEIVESGPTADVLRAPLHPYTRGLLESIPQPGAGRRRLGAIPGMVPALTGAVPGCAFASRCALAAPSCRAAPPPLRTLEGRAYRCVIEPAALSATLATLRPANEDAAREERSAEAGTPILEARSVRCTFRVRRGLFARSRNLDAVDGVSLDLARGEALALVGESGCGKTTLARILLGLQAPSAGEVLLDGRPLGETAMRRRARRIQPVFQDPYGSLNPRRSIGEIIRRPLDVHGVGEPARRRLEVEAMMERVGLAPRLHDAYPGQLSGGQRQRVAIARALVVRPQVLVCDEPTSALDVSVQSQILNLLGELRDEMGLTYLVITHDLGVVEHLASRVAVMYSGQIVEIGDKEAIFRAPRHPYTRILLDSVMTLRPGAGVPDTALGAAPSDALAVPSGCRFHPRCPKAIARCVSEAPALEGNVRCLLAPAR
ncbi:MAG TPA: ABC transporter ATP-binding protein [Usitatibacter sp.]|nr:ABC transporter ATP-binding protein [Usitatibacter sp.]